MSKNGKYSGATTIERLESMNPKLHGEVEGFFKQSPAVKWFSFSGDVTMDQVCRWCKDIPGAAKFFDHHFGIKEGLAAPKPEQNVQPAPQSVCRRKAEHSQSPQKPKPQKPVQRVKENEAMPKPTENRTVARTLLSPVEIAQMILSNVGPLITTAYASEAQILPLRNLVSYMLDCKMEVDLASVVGKCGVTISKTGELMQGDSGARQIRQNDLYKMMEELVTLAEEQNLSRPVSLSLPSSRVPMPK